MASSRPAADGSSVETGMGAAVRQRSVQALALLACQPRSMVTPMVPAMQSRRPLKSRQREWAIALAGMLVQAGVPPNVISLASIGFAALAGAALLATSVAGGTLQSVLWLAAAIGIQLRLLC